MPPVKHARKPARAGLFGALLLLANAGGCTSYKADVETICDAPRASPVDPRAQGGDEAYRFMLDWSARNTHTAQGKALIDALGQASTPQERGVKLRAAAADAKLAACPMADWLEAPP